MQADRYVKTVLTVIAACLVYLCVALTAWPSVSAAADQDVYLAGWIAAGDGGRIRTVRFPEPGGLSTHPAPLPVSGR